AVGGVQNRPLRRGGRVGRRRGDAVVLAGVGAVVVVVGRAAVFAAGPGEAAGGVARGGGRVEALRTFANEVGQAGRGHEAQHRLVAGLRRGADERAAGVAARVFADETLGDGDRVRRAVGDPGVARRRVDEEDAVGVKRRPAAGAGAGADRVIRWA